MRRAWKWRGFSVWGRSLFLGICVSSICILIVLWKVTNGVPHEEPSAACCRVPRVACYKGETYTDTTGTD